MCRWVPGLAALGLIIVSCAVAPVAYHDGLPASTPAPGFAAARFEYSRAYWWNRGDPQRLRDCFMGGVRFGQDWRWLCFEEGLTVLYPGELLPCLQAGIGLRAPAVTLRALWTPVSFRSRIHFDPTRWWQVSGLIGTPRRSRGLSVSYGARTSRIGIGPVALMGYTHSGISIRLETSMTFPTPWAESRVQGRVLTVGLSAEPTKGISKSP